MLLLCHHTSIHTRAPEGNGKRKDFHRFGDTRTSPRCRCHPSLRSGAGIRDYGPRSGPDGIFYFCHRHYARPAKPADEACVCCWVCRCTTKRPSPGFSAQFLSPYARGLPLPPPYMPTQARAVLQPSVLFQVLRNTAHTTFVGQMDGW